jgi:hypothetical protein
MTANILFLSTIVIIWWIAMWGLIEIFLKKMIGPSTNAHIIAYLLMITLVIGIVYLYPRTGESFI